MIDARDIRLEPYKCQWAPADPNANFREEVSEYSQIDPLPTLVGISVNFDIPVGALARYILAKWATSYSDAHLALGPRIIQQMSDCVQEAESVATDEARLKAYRKLASMISWLEWPNAEGSTASIGRKHNKTSN